MGIYTQALDYVTAHPGTGGSVRMAKCVLSLWNHECAFAISEVLGSMDDAGRALVLSLVQEYSTNGETEELVRVGHQVNEFYPRLWDLGYAGHAAKSALLAQWERETEETASDDSVPTAAG